jgi:asparagine N-glycosylation enzyme membrane subunit Stt3
LLLLAKLHEHQEARHPLDRDLGVSGECEKSTWALLVGDVLLDADPFQAGLSLPGMGELSARTDALMPRAETGKMLRVQHPHCVQPNSMLDREGKKSDSSGKPVFHMEGLRLAGQQM